MNIDQYRAIKASEATKGTENSQPEVVVETNPQATETTVEPTVVENTIPDEIEIDGIGKVKVSELKNGYLRQADYTKKTQELSNSKKELEEAVKVYDYLKAHPDIAGEMVKKSEGVGTSLTSEGKRINELEQKIFDMTLQLEIDRLSKKYDDFEVRDVLITAKEKNMTDLEDAYKLTVASKKANPQEVDATALREQLRREILKELEEEGNGTRTLVGVKSSKATSPTTAVISQAEQRVAQRMRLSNEEYITWRDANKN